MQFEQLNQVNVHHKCSLSGPPPTPNAAVGEGPCDKGGRSRLRSNNSLGSLGAHTWSNKSLSNYVHELVGNRFPRNALAETVLLHRCHGNHSGTSRPKRNPCTGRWIWLIPRHIEALGHHTNPAWSTALANARSASNCPETVPVHTRKKRELASFLTSKTWRGEVSLP